MKKDLDISFPYTSKKEWLTLIEQSLKGQSIEDLQNEFQHKLELSPFQHYEDLPDGTHSPIDYTSTSFPVGEDLTCIPFEELNKEARDALDFGANAIRLPLSVLGTKKQTADVLKGIQLPMIHLSLSLQGLSLEQISKNLNHVYHFITGRSDRLPGSMSLEFTPETFTRWIKRNESLFGSLDGHIVQRWLQFHTDLAQPIQSITDTAELLAQFLLQPTSNCKEIGKKISFRVTAGTDFLINIAGIRALKIVMANILDDLNSEASFNGFFIEGNVLQKTIKEDLRVSYIPATYKAMSLMAGGAQRLYLQTENRTEESKRITRNINHLLLLESAFNAVKDPAAGSYYIELMTYKLASEAWEALINKNIKKK